MATEKNQNSFRRGVASIVILSLLRQRDMYGYQIAQELSRQSNGKIEMQEGSLYPVLYKLEEQGYISEKRVLVGKRMTRIYYHLDQSGEERLKELIREYEDTTQGVFNIIYGNCGGQNEDRENRQKVL